MLALALVLLAIVVVLVVASFAGSSEEVVIDFLNVTVTSSVGGVFVAGVVCGLVALASALTAKASWRRHRKRRKEVQELRRRAERATPPSVPAQGEAPGQEQQAAETVQADYEPGTTEAGAPVDDSDSTSDSTSDAPRTPPRMRLGLSLGRNARN